MVASNIGDKEEDKFKFAVALLTTFGTILYVVYNYYQNAAITNEGIDRLLRSTLELGIVSSIGLIIYISLIGASKGAPVYLRKKIEKWASKIYSITFIIIVIELIKTIIFVFTNGLDLVNNHLKIDSVLVKLITFIVFFAILLYVFIFKPHWINHKSHWINHTSESNNKIGIVFAFVAFALSLLIMAWFYLWDCRIYLFIILIISYLLIVYRHVMNRIIERIFTITPGKISWIDYIHRNFKNLKESNRIFALIIICVGFLLLDLYFEPVPYYFAEGRVDFNMGSIYYKNDTQIPVSVEITGRNFQINASLFKENFNYTSNNYTRTPKENISIRHPENDTTIGWIKNLGAGNEKKELPRTIFGNSTLVVTVLDKQNYNIFINTTNLTGGYYLLVITPPNGKNYSKAFYLFQ